MIKMTKMIERSETNNAIIVKLENVRKHPNADRLQLATVLGTQVIVGLESKEGDVMVYFDSNLKLSHDYLAVNNLYANPELNADDSAKGYFPNTGRVKAQKLRGELSNGFVASWLNCMALLDTPLSVPSVGTEFQSIYDIKICEKYVPVGLPASERPRNKKKEYRIVSDMFHTHWDTKQLMREQDRLYWGAEYYIEEKIHGTSGRTANVLVKHSCRWWQHLLGLKGKEEWKVVSGTRRVDSINAHIPQVRQEIHDQISPLLKQGEEVYYEIYGYAGGKEIQKGFHYDCRPGEYKAMLYRVTYTLPDGTITDLSRRAVYRRAEELGLVKPWVLTRSQDAVHALQLCDGVSMLGSTTMREGVVVWFETPAGKWTCLKHKSEKFLCCESKNRDKGINDTEDVL